MGRSSSGDEEPPGGGAGGRGLRGAEVTDVRRGAAASSMREVGASDRLPLTCARGDVCCFGMAVWLEPYAIARLARGLGLPPEELVARHTVDGGLRLRASGPSGARGEPACDLYRVGAGCSVHGDRPLACRLYPLRRELRQGTATYGFDGPRLPCLAGCPDVARLPERTVADYLAEQQVAPHEAAQVAYLEVMQDLAEGAFVLLFDSGLAATGDRATLPRWRRLGALTPDARATAVGPEWLAALLTPPLPPDDPAEFARQHAARLQARAQSSFAALSTAEGLRDASCTMLALALHLGQGLGVAPAVLSARWVQAARDRGARG